MKLQGTDEARASEKTMCYSISVAIFQEYTIFREYGILIKDDTLQR